ncbi:MAG: hypothetical protein JNK73_03380 [Bacteroidia bacterium]|nr:hypothetical protein [Bacteroidia bacterium]
MALKLNLAPAIAWRTYITPFIQEQKIIEISDHISSEIGLSKRELMGLIIYSYSLDKSGGLNVYWDDSHEEPNDGFIRDKSENVVRCEHKLVAQFNREEVIKAMLDTYNKYANRGKSYGENRHLIIQTNLNSNGLAKISKVHNEIENKCVFDKVFLLHVNGFEPNNVIRFSFSEQYPKLCLSHIKIDSQTGECIN